MKARAIFPIGLIILLTLFGCGCEAKRQATMPDEFIHIPGPNPILERGELGEWDDNCIETSDIIKMDGTYYLYYHATSGKTSDVQHYSIGLASASDPLGPWEKCVSNPLLTPGSPGEWDDDHVAAASILKIGDIFYMWYSGMRENAYPRWDVGLATAQHLEGPWTKYSGNPIMEDFGYVGGILKVGDKYYLYSNYPIDPESDLVPLALATANSPEGPYTRYEGNPVLSPGPPGSWDEAGCSDSKVCYHDGMFLLFYSGNICPNPSKLNEHRTSIGYAYSVDGFKFVKYEDNPVAPWEKNPGCFKLSEARTLIEPPLIYIYTTFRHGPDYESSVKDIGVQVLVVPDWVHRQSKG